MVPPPPGHAPLNIEPREYDRRGSDRPADDSVGRRFRQRMSQPVTPKSLLLAIGGPLLVALLSWAAAEYRPVTSARFRADSSRRDREKASSDSLLIRIDSRVGEMYCADKPPGCR